jgi:hypothetical protein
MLLVVPSNAFLPSLNLCFPLSIWFKAHPLFADVFCLLNKRPLAYTFLSTFSHFSIASLFSLR